MQLCDYVKVVIIGYGHKSNTECSTGNLANKDCLNK